jgi:phosphoribosylformimino-5-aminoimidazole carboxamide ribotide isomerase
MSHFSAMTIPAKRLPRIIPVIDVMGGKVVRAVGGRRECYRPIRSELAKSTEPLAVAKVLRTTTQAHDLYVADLDAIRGNARVSISVLALLGDMTNCVWADLGLRCNNDVEGVPPAANLRTVIASETAAEPGLVGWASTSRTREGGVAFSLDLDDGVIRGRWWEWGLESPRDVVGLATRAIEYGANALIVLELSAVGTGKGPQTLDVCRAIRAELPKIELVSGGGVRDWDDVRRLGECGVDAVLVSSAIHNGSLTFPPPDS